MRPTSMPPMEISKNTTGFPRPIASAITGSMEFFLIWVE
jgi:hypothetical protein